MDLEEDLKDLEAPSSTLGTFKDLPTLADLEVPVETPSHRTVELQEPKVPIADKPPIAEAEADKPPIGEAEADQLKEVYRQDLELERQLRR